MNTLDSRSLRYTDCFAQKFSAPGHVHYSLTTTAGAGLPADEDPFTIDVNKRPKQGLKGRQHNVVVKQEGRKLVADPAHLEIDVGDIVLWNAPDPSTTGYVVRGKGEGGAFDSSALNSESIYTHAFGTAGDYEWVDSNGGEYRGLIRVKSLNPDDREECKKWLGELSNGALVTVEGDRVQPAEVRILTGQTVFWAIQKAPGIAVTDARLVGKGRTKGSINKIKKKGKGK